MILRAHLNVSSSFLGKMYTIIPNISVKLTEKDVPGAELLYKKVEKNTICQLKRWLKCRKQLLTGMYSMKVIFRLVILRNA